MLHFFVIEILPKIELKNTPFPKPAGILLHLILKTDAF